MRFLSFILFNVIITLCFISFSFKLVPINPYIRQIEGSKKDLNLITKEIKDLGKKIDKDLLGQGNFPISIGFENFQGEDEELLGYAITSPSDCEIKLNLTEKWTKKKLKLVLYHEMGHCLGLEHDNPSAIMSSEYQDEQVEFESLDRFYTELTLKENVILAADTGLDSVDSVIDESLDNLFRTSKDSLKRQELISIKSSFSFKPNESRKIRLEE